MPRMYWKCFTFCLHAKKKSTKEVKEEEIDHVGQLGRLEKRG